MSGGIILLWAGAYLVASIPFGVLVARMKGVDIRRHGSGNIGATNVGRVLGRRWGLTVLALDVLKGTGPMAAGQWCVRRGWVAMPDWGPAASDWLVFGLGVACVIGSVAPVYLRFRGGKAVATSLGVLLGVPALLAPVAAALVVYGVVRRWSGYVSLGSLTAAASLPIAFVGISAARDVGVWERYPLLVLCVLLATVVFVRHRANIARLAAGTEPRLESATRDSAGGPDSN